MSIARSPERQMSAGDLAIANVLARKPSVGVLPRSRERSIKRLTDRNEPVQNSAPDRALELTIRSINENE